jgi:phosphatidylinositol alpha-mannosyltransferase
MRVALLGENYYPTLGGIQEHIHALARYLIRRGDHVRVITGLPRVDSWSGPPDEDWVIRVGRARRYGAPGMGTCATLTFGMGAAARLRRVLADERFDLVHVHGPCDVGLPTLLYTLYDGPLVVTLHSPINDRSPLRHLAAPYYQWVLRRADTVISVSPTARAAMSRYATFDSVVVPNGVDSRAFSRGRPMSRFQDGRTNILMLGRLEARNGPDILLDALPTIAEARPDVRLIVAGAGRNGTAAHARRVPAALRDRVVFLGEVFGERADLYASSRLCVVPARSGTFSIIVLEALAAGVPVVATPFIEGWERMRHFEPVMVAPDFSPEAVARTVLDALDEDPRARIAMGRAIAREFDWSRVAAGVVDVYEEVLRRREVQGWQVPRLKPAAS